jgi:hypothetical protein
LRRRRSLVGGLETSWCFYFCWLLIGWFALGDWNLIGDFSGP